MFSAHFIRWALPWKFEYIGIAILAKMATTATEAMISSSENPALCPVWITGNTLEPTRSKREAKRNSGFQRSNPQKVFRKSRNLCMKVGSVDGLTVPGLVVGLVIVGLLGVIIVVGLVVGGVETGRPEFPVKVPVFALWI
jgi:hypothetical protein